jgi:hypothetical protein
MKRKGLVVLGILVVCYSQILLAQNGNRESIMKTAYAGEKILIYSSGWEFSTGSGWESGNPNIICVRFSTESKVKEWFLIVQRYIIDEGGWEGYICVFPSPGFPTAEYDIYATIPKNAEGVYKATIRFFAGSGVTITGGDFFIDITITVLGENNYQWKYAPINSIISDLVSSGANINQLESPLNDLKEKHEVGQYREANKLLDDLQLKVQDLRTNFYPARDALEVVKTNLERAKALGVNVLIEESRFKVIEKEYNKGNYVSAKKDLEYLRILIDTKIGQFNDAKGNIQKATSGIVELDKMIFASTKKSDELLKNAEIKFVDGDYIGASLSASKVFQEIENEKMNAKENKNTFLKVLALLVVISIVIGIVIWRNRKRAEDNKIIEESPTLLPQKETIIESVEKSAAMIEKESSKKKKIIETKKKEDQEKQKDLALRKLAKQYANNEITREEYERLRKMLEEVM